MTSSQVQLRQLKPQPTLNIRAGIPTAQLQQAQDEGMRALSAHLKKLGLKPAGPPYVRYHTFSKEETDMEVGVPVSEPARGEDRIQSGTLPGGPAISTPFTNANDIGGAYASLSGWQKDHQRPANGPAWEIYEWIDLLDYNPANWPSPAQWRGELVQPVQETSS